MAAGLPKRRKRKKSPGGPGRPEPLRAPVLANPIDRAHRFLLLGYAGALALFEGPAQIACVLVLGAALLAGRARRHRLGLFELGVAIWWLAGIPGLFGLEHRPSSGDWTRPLMALAALVGAWSIDRDDEWTLGRLAWIFGGALTLNGIYGVAQYLFGQFPWDVLFLKNPASGQVWIPDRVYHEIASSGLYYNRLKLAHMGLVGLALFGVVALSKGARRRARHAAGFAALGLGLGVLLTYARAALLSLGLATAALNAGRARRGTWLKLGAAAGFVALLLLSTEYGRSRFTSLGPDTELRLGLFLSAWRLFTLHPIFGVGHGAYALTVGPLLPAGASGVHLTSPHNLWLQVLAETGAVGLLGFCLATGLAWYRGARRAWASLGSGAPEARLDRFVFLGLTGLTLTGLTHATLHHAIVALLFWTLAGIAARR